MHKAQFDVQAAPDCTVHARKRISGGVPMWPSVAAQRPESTIWRFKCGVGGKRPPERFLEKKTTTRTTKKPSPRQKACTARCPHPEGSRLLQQPRLMLHEDTSEVSRTMGGCSWAALRRNHPVAETFTVDLRTHTHARTHTQ